VQIVGPNFDSRAKIWIEKLDEETTYSRCRTWSGGHLDEQGNVAVRDGTSGPFDVPLLPEVSLASVG
jgi:hypothetical protein